MHFAAPKTCLVEAICSDAFSSLWAGVGNLAPSNEYLAMVVLAPTIKYQIPTTKYKIPTTLSTRYNHQLRGKSYLASRTASVGSSVDVMASEQYLGTRRLFACFVHHCCALALILGSWYLLLGTCNLLHGIFLVLGSLYLLLFAMPRHHCTMGDWPARGRCPPLVGLSTPWRLHGSKALSPELRYKVHESKPYSACYDAYYWEKRSKNLSRFGGIEDQ